MEFLKKNKAKLREEAPLKGYTERLTSIPAIEALSDDDLAELNQLLPWSCFVVDGQGRRFGRPAGWLAGAPKRPRPERLPDNRIVKLDEKIPLRNLTVLEVGCFEGLHTVALAQRAKHVKACDSRMVNLAKTAVRCAMFQVGCTLFHWNVEEPAPDGQDIGCDVLHHVGVLYHLADPVGHLRRIAPFVRKAIMLDTHYCAEAEATQSYEVDGHSHACREVPEAGVWDVFSGMNSMSRWLRLDDLTQLLKALGFAEVEVETRAERYGPRALIIAERRA